MHRPAFRSALEITSRSIRPSAPAPASSPAGAAAFFSTTSFQSALKWVPSSKELQAQAASEISSLDDGSAGPAGTAAAGAAKPASPSSPFSKQAAPESGNHIINMRSLPRTLGSRFPGTGVSDATTSNTGGRFRNSVEGAGSRSPRSLTSSNAITLVGPAGGRFAGRLGARGRPARARMARTNRPKRAKRDDKEKRAESLTEEQEQELYVEAREWLHFHEFGRPEPFEPALTREGLLGYSPAVASTTGPDGYLSTALRSMRLVAGGKPFGGAFEPGESNTDASPNPEGQRSDLHKKQPVFFDTIVERVRTQRALQSKRMLVKLKDAGLPANTPLIKDVSAVTKAAITEAAMLGLYDGPSSASISIKSPVLDTAQRYQAQDHTYSPAKALQFEAKLRELMPKTAEAARA